jgi:hypothetical protein
VSERSQNRGSAILCGSPECRFPLARFNRDRRHPSLTPGVHMLVDVTESRVVHLICPRCGKRKSLTDVVVAAMAIPRIVGETR